jgi:cytochrome oxidase Cu insertion factor (SCO1/SenC/PrrC family)
MKRVLLLYSFIMIVSATLLAQKPASGIPPFKMLQTNGRYFTSKDLDRKKPVVLVYFAPDCDHCQVLMQGIFKNIDAFKNVQLVLVTFKPASELALFERQYNTAKYANIKAGTEGTTFFLRYHYKLTNTPFTAIYNASGNLVCAYKNINTPVSEILNCMKGLK